MIVYIKQLKKGNQFKFNGNTYTVKQKYSNWKKDNEPYLLTSCGQFFFYDEIEVEFVYRGYNKFYSKK